MLFPKSNAIRSDPILNLSAVEELDKRCEDFLAEELNLKIDFTCEAAVPILVEVSIPVGNLHSFGLDYPGRGTNGTIFFFVGPVAFD